MTSLKVWAAALSIALSLPAVGQEVAGEWKAGWAGALIEDESGHQTFVDRCVASVFGEGRLFLDADGRGGFAGGYVQWQSVSVDGVHNKSDVSNVEEVCQLRHTYHPIIGNQVKEWKVAVRPANDGRYEAYGHSGDCSNDWCNDYDPRFAMRVGADDWAASYSYHDGKIIDDFGTPSTDDDVIFLRKSAFDNLTGIGEQHSLRFIKAVFEKDFSTASSLSYAGSHELRIALAPVIVQLARGGVSPERYTIVQSSVTTSNAPRYWRVVSDVLLSNGAKVRIRVIMAEGADGTPGVSWAWFGDLLAVNPNR